MSAKDNARDSGNEQPAEAEGSAASTRSYDSITSALVGGPEGTCVEATRRSVRAPVQPRRVRVVSVQAGHLRVRCTLHERGSQPNCLGGGSGSPREYESPDGGANRRVTGAVRWRRLPLRQGATAA